MLRACFGCSPGRAGDRDTGAVPADMSSMSLQERGTLSTKQVDHPSFDRVEDAATFRKRPRLTSELRQEHQQQQQRASAADHHHHHHHHHHHNHRLDGEEDGVGCVCANAGCPWSFGSRPRYRQQQWQQGSSTEATGVHACSGAETPLRQFFDGPLLSAKEYRDRPTGEVR